jgi:hypothetical protein
MILAMKISGYAVLLLLLTFGGNLGCKLVLRWSATKPPPESGERSLCAPGA